MKKLLFLFGLLSLSINAQNKYLTKTGTVDFEASMPAFEAVSAKNNAVTAILNIENGEFASLVLVKGFRFKNALMEEHFNESYLESEKHPRATFEGAILNWEELNPTAEWQEVVASGKLNVHGVSQTRTIQGQMQFNAGSWEIRAQFDVLTADHEIRIPKMVRNQIAESITVYVDAVLTPR